MVFNRYNLNFPKYKNMENLKCDLAECEFISDIWKKVIFNYISSILEKNDPSTELRVLIANFAV